MIGSRNDMKLIVFSQSIVKNDEDKGKGQHRLQFYLDFFEVSYILICLFYYQILYKFSILDSLIDKILMGRILQNKLDFCTN